MSELARRLRESTNNPPSVTPGTGSLTDWFDEEVVPLDVFCRDKKFLGMDFDLSPVQFSAVQHAERVLFDGWETVEDDEGNPILDDEGNIIKRYIPERDAYRLMGEQMDPYWLTPIRMTNFITIEWGKGAGKDHVGRVSALRVAYILMCLRNPLNYFGKPDQDTIHILNVAATAPQAMNAFFKPMKRAVERKGNWFEDRCHPTVNVIEFAKNIEAHSGHSDTETQEGLNIILGIADEIDAFKSKENARFNRGGAEPINTVEGILDMIHTSGSTRFGQTFKNIRMSFPRFKGSPIQNLIAKATKDVQTRGEISRHFVSGPLATWQVNPSVRKTDFAQDYEDDPIMAAAKYECKPTQATNAFFRNQIVVESCFVKTDQMPVEIEGYEHNGNSWNPIYKFSPEFYPVQGGIYAMHADMSLNGDRAGISMAHVVKRVEVESLVPGEDGEELLLREFRPLVKVDFTIAYEADIGSVPAREIQIRWARHLAFELIKMGFMIQSFTFDKFESTDSIQILNARGIESERLSTDLSPVPWKTVRDLANEGRLIAAHDQDLLDELFSLNQMPNGKVDHPPMGKKDKADAFACAIVGAINLGGQESEGSPRAYFGGMPFDSGSTSDEGLDMPYGFSSNMIGWD